MGPSGHFYLHVDPVWSLKNVGTCCTLGRAPRTNETLPDFREWCRVTRHPRVFRGLTGCQRDTPRSGRHTYIYKIYIKSHNPAFFSIPASKERRPLVTVLYLKCGPRAG